jgi:ATP-dependent RNA helicase DDX46/PRP5
MARHRDSRSPSPAGSQHSSKRGKRDDELRRDRDRRDDGRLPRRRSRSRSVDVRLALVREASSQRTDSLHHQRRHRDRDMHRRRDRSIDRREDDYRSGRRERSRDRRDRYVERERSPDRRRRRSRDRDYRDRRDDSYDRARRRREDSTDSWTRSRGDGNVGKPPGRPESVKATEVSPYPSSYADVWTNTAVQSAKPPTPPAQTEAEKKAERLAKLEAWKKKMAEDKERKEKDLAASGSRKLLDDIDQKANVSPSLGSPASPSTPNSVASPAPYAGKFDPKAIAKKAAANSTATSTLGKDLPLKELTKASATLTSSVKGLQADKKPTAFNSTSNGKFAITQPTCRASANKCIKHLRYLKPEEI